MFKTDATVRFGQILSAIELLGMGNFNEYYYYSYTNTKSHTSKEVNAKKMDSNTGMYGVDYCHDIP